MAQYKYELGAKTVVQGPPPDYPGHYTTGAAQVFTYDDAGRLQQVTTANNGASMQYIYGEYYVLTLNSINTAGDNFALTFINGGGGVYATLSDHPGTGHYRAQYTRYDAISRIMRQTNPTEINGSWQAAGDDDPNNGGAGWVFAQQTYDWKGRPLETRHLTDGTTKEAIYGGCGCAGGEVETGKLGSGLRFCDSHQ